MAADEVRGAAANTILRRAFSHGCDKPRVISKAKVIIATKCFKDATRYFDFDIAGALRLLEATSQSCGI
jgi:hypothetical protein